MKTTIILDAMGTDSHPQPEIEAALMAVEKFDIDRRWRIGQHSPASFTDLEVRAPREADQAGFAEVALGPVHAVGERGLLARRQEL